MRYAHTRMAMRRYRFLRTLRAAMDMVLPLVLPYVTHAQRLTMTRHAGSIGRAAVRYARYLDGQPVFAGPMDLPCNERLSLMVTAVANESWDEAHHHLRALREAPPRFADEAMLTDIAECLIPEEEM